MFTEAIGDGANPVLRRLDTAFGLKRKSTLAWLTVFLGFFFLIRSVSDFVAPLMLSMSRMSITLINGITLIVPRLFICFVLVAVGINIVRNQKRLEREKRPDFDPEFTIDELRSKGEEHAAEETAY
jgi:hypothetical protein